MQASAVKRFFAVAVDPHTYGAVFYMLLSLATGIFYFTWVTTGLSMSAGLMILIIGIPFFILFMASVYAISLVEGRLVETLLGVRMPRRPLYQAKHSGWLDRIKALFSDSRTWLSLMYMVLMLPLGIVYFTLTVAMLSLSVGLIAAPVLWWMAQLGWISFHGHFQMGTGSMDPALASPFLFVGGILLSVRQFARVARHRPMARPLRQARAGGDRALIKRCTSNEKGRRSSALFVDTNPRSVNACFGKGRWRSG